MIIKVDKNRIVSNKDVHTEEYLDTNKTDIYKYIKRFNEKQYPKLGYGSHTPPDNIFQIDKNGITLLLY